MNKARRSVEKGAEVARRSVGLRDVARAAGVSTATVSRAMNRPDAVSPALRARVAAVVEALGWQPDAAARALTTRRSQTVGAVFPALSVGDFAVAAQAIQSELSAADYTLLLACSDYDPELEWRQARVFAQRGVDGLILVGRAHHHALEPFLVERKLPFVETFVFDRDAPAPCVGPDNRKAMSTMTEHLAGLGHRRFGVIAQSGENNDRARSRLEGVREALARRGLAVRPQHLVTGSWTIEEGRALLRRVMQTDPAPTAVICGNAHLAVGAVLEALAMGLRVPDEVSIVGYDDIEIMRHLSVPVTTVRVPGEEIGRAAARVVIDMIEGRASAAPLEAQAELVIRASSGPPPTAAKRVSR